LPNITVKSVGGLLRLIIYVQPTSVFTMNYDFVSAKADLNVFVFCKRRSQTTHY